MLIKDVKFFIQRILASSLCLISHCVLAQEYAGIVLDSTNNTPIAYVNIGIAGKNIGTVSDTNGHFKIDLESMYDSDTLRFSMIGFATKDFIISKFRKQKLNEKVKIWLNPKTIILHEVVVVSSKQLPMALGYKPKSKLTNAGFIYNQLGHEIGCVFKNSNRELIIDSVRLNFAKCRYDNIYMRLNIYKMQDHKIENILAKPVYVTLTRDEALKNPTLNITECNVFVNTDFLISVELVKELGEKGLYFYATLNDNTYPGIYRETSQGNWIYMENKSKPFGISIMAFVH